MEISEPIQIENSGFDALKIFELFEEEIKKINIYPINEENITIHKDALNRLSSEENIPDRSFAYLDFKKIESDIQFEFRLEFYRQLAIFFLPNGNIPVYFTLYSDKEKIVNDITVILKMLCNGQIQILTSYKNNKPFAQEIIIFRKNRITPDVVSTVAKIPLFSRGEYKVIAYKNNLLEDFVEIPDDFYMFKKDDDGEFPILGRKIENIANVSALSKQEYEKFLNTVNWQKTGIKEGEDRVLFILKQWKFWVFVIPYAICVVFLYQSNIIPKEFRTVFLIFATSISASFLPVLFRKTKK